MAKYIKAKYKFNGQPREIRIAPQYTYWVYVRLQCGGWWMMDVRPELNAEKLAEWRSLRLSDPQAAIDLLALFLETRAIDARLSAAKVL